MAEGLPPGEDTMVAHAQPIEPACRVCGCTQNAACVDAEKGACWWVEPDLCSHCRPYVAMADQVDPAKLKNIAARAFLVDALGKRVSEIEEEASQRLRRIERSIEWVMVPTGRSDELMIASVGSIQTFAKNARVSYAHALGERIGPIEGMDRAQATVVAEVVHGATTKRRVQFDDARAEAKANGWVVYGRKGLEERASDLLKAAGIEWLSISLGGGDDDGVSIITLKGPVPDELPEGIMRQKPTKESPQ